VKQGPGGTFTFERAGSTEEAPAETHEPAAV
jgi:hypothetical protein